MARKKDVRGSSKVAQMDGGEICRDSDNNDWKKNI